MMKKVIALALALCSLLALGACGKEELPEHTVAEVFDAIALAYGDDFLIDGDMNEAEYTETYGLDMEEIEEIEGSLAMISFRPDRLLVVKAKEGKGESVEKKLQAARENLVENGMWYPANLAKVNASKVMRRGDMVVFMMLGADDERTDVSEDEAAKFAEEQMKIGVDAFEALYSTKK